MLCIRCEKPTTDEESCPTCGESPLVDGRYRVLEVLGRGANATTYKAERIAGSEIVALKELLVRNADSLKTLELFEREAQVLEQLNYRRIPRYIEDFTVDFGARVGIYLVQSFVEGSTLHDTIEAEALSAPDAVEIARGIAETLAYLHDLSPPVIHRDIKPQNIILGPHGSVAVIDFGSVQDALSRDDDGVPTMAGTVGFMAPEQLLGQALPASDVYGLGVTVSCMFAGEGDPAVASKDWENNAPDGVVDLVRAMLASQSTNRPTASEVANRLREGRLVVDEWALARQTKHELVEQYAERPRDLPSDFSRELNPQMVGIVLLVVALIGGTVAAELLGWVAGVAVTLLTVAFGFLIRHALHVGDGHAELYREGLVAVGTISGKVKRMGQYDVFYTVEIDGTQHHGTFVYRPSGPKRYSSVTDRGQKSKERFATGEPVVVFYDPQQLDPQPLPKMLTSSRLR